MIADVALFLATLALGFATYSFWRASIRAHNDLHRLRQFAMWDAKFADNAATLCLADDMPSELLSEIKNMSDLIEDRDIAEALLDAFESDPGKNADNTDALIELVCHNDTYRAAYAQMLYAFIMSVSYFRPDGSGLKLREVFIDTLTDCKRCKAVDSTVRTVIFAPRKAAGIVLLPKAA